MPKCPYPQLIHSLPEIIRYALITQKKFILQDVPKCTKYENFAIALQMCMAAQAFSSVRKSVSVIHKCSLSHPLTSGHLLLPLCCPLNFFHRLLKPDQILYLRGIIYHYLVMSSQEQLQVEYCCQMLCIIKLQPWENILRVIVSY